MAIRDVFATYARFSADTFWPGFDPHSVPLALFDGEQTWLFGYPGTPPGFAPAAESGLLVSAGRHPAILANSTSDVDGVLVATLIVDRAMLRKSAAVAALALHEAFHVYQRRAHPEWAANEADLFTYPASQFQIVAQTNLERYALKRALHQRNAAAWAALAMDFRHTRFAAMPPAAVQYERQTELMEGLAHYVELQALGLPPRGLTDAALELRSRCYTSGAAMAFLLDQLSPGWQQRLEAGDASSLDALVATAPAVRQAVPDIFPPREHAAILLDAQQAVTESAATMRETRRAFFAQPGAQLVMHAAPGAPLRVRGFDPMNVTVLGNGEVLHSRYLALESAGATLELLDGAAITLAAGAHPLFDGVQTVTLAGLPPQQLPASSDSPLAITLPGVRLEAAAARVKWVAATLTVHLA
ncbi:MAG: hypothetical protein QM692_15775 [Thermomicrobiales bacterium]